MIWLRRGNVSTGEIEAALRERREEVYPFVSGTQLVADFLEDVARLTQWRVE